MRSLNKTILNCRKVPAKIEGVGKNLLILMLVGFGFMLLVSCGVKDGDQNKGIKTMKKRIVNPWKWQDKYGFVQANEVTNARRTLYTAGIVSVDGEGNLVHGGNMEKQIDRIMDNMETILEQANFKLSDVVRFTYYTTDVPAFIKANPMLVQRLEKANCKPATSLIGVKSLFHPECVVEIEAVIMD